MKSLLLTPVVFALALTSSHAEYATTLQYWQDGDLAVQGVLDSEYFSYSDAELEELVPFIAKWISIREALENSTDDSWKQFETEHEWTPYLKNNKEINVRWGMSHQAAWVIRILAEKQRLTEQSVFPVLIEGLNSPSYSFTARNCFAALTALTKLYDGPLTSWAYVNYPDDTQLISEWFNNWYLKNKSKQLIVTPLLDSEIKNEFLGITSKLERIVSENPNSLYGFKSPDEKIYHGVGYPLYHKLWEGEYVSTPIGYTGFRDGWVLICVRPQSDLIRGIKGWERWLSWDIIEEIPEKAQKVYQHFIPDTDWVLEVYVDRLPREEVSILKEGLSEAET